MNSKKLPSHNLEWIFFDVGGVLVSNGEFENRRKQSILSIVKQFNPEIDTDDYQIALVKASFHIGDLSVSMITELLPDPVHAQKAIAMLHAYRAEHQHERYEPEFRPDAQDTVSKLSKCYRLGIIANQPRAMQEKIEAAGLAQFFSHIGLSETHDLHKPDKRLFQTILDQTGADPIRSVMIDDNIERGLLPAHELGMKTIWYKLHEREKPGFVDDTITGLSELIKIFIKP